jgi:hypothetical protein
VTLLVAGVWFGNASLEVLAAIAGVLATGTGWSLKYTLVVRAAFYRRKSFSLSAMMATGSAGG